MPILDERTLEFISHSPEQTKRLGVRLGEMLRPQDVILLAGDLGAGKTTLAQGIARGWGSLDPVTSPTFVLINQYRRADGMVLYHMDAYRLGGAAEARALGMEEIFEGDGPVLLEWPENIEGALPEERLLIRLYWVDEMRRRLSIEAGGMHYERLLKQFSKTAFGA